MTTASHNIALHRYSIFTAGFTLLMIVAGGMVTSMAAGDAVPDWPLSYGTLLPPMVGNIFYEHGHRLIGMTLGLLVIVQWIWLLRAERRPAVLRMGWIALAWVCVLGGLGGLRVKLISSPAVQSAVMNAFGSLGVESVESARALVAIVHTTLAQCFLCLMACIALVTSPQWRAWGDAQPSAAAARLRRLSLITTVLIVVQLILGAVRRHTEGTIILHLIGATLVALHVGLLFRRVMIDFSQVPALLRTSLLMLGAVTLQMVLGAFAWVLTATLAGTAQPRPVVLGSEPLGSALLTAHVALGALLLVAGVLFTILAFRLLVPASAADPRMPAKGRYAPA